MTASFVFSLEDVRIIAKFTDKEGGTFDDVYLSEEFQAKTKEIQQKGQAAMEEAIMMAIRSK